MAAILRYVRATRAPISGGIEPVKRPQKYMQWTRKKLESNVEKSIEKITPLGKP